MHRSRVIISGKAPFRCLPKRAARICSPHNSTRLEARVLLETPGSAWPEGVPGFEALWMRRLFFPFSFFQRIHLDRIWKITFASCFKGFLPFGEFWVSLEMAFANVGAFGAADGRQRRGQSLTEFANGFSSSETDIEQGVLESFGVSWSLSALSRGYRSFDRPLVTCLKT